ncbi:hypothetical protein TcasGA2_TC010638 [Tribolium castaneum]|uniref:Uncharacterized protein n=1 Tax=Tribolium castaneum TaxID=7070 RepID=D6X2L6_TRICA|nr:hypothetical protein TcasGA2_TC010638 [Tribolium castaneum]
MAGVLLEIDTHTKIGVMTHAIITVEHVPGVVILGEIVLETARTHFPRTINSHRTLAPAFVIAISNCFDNKTADCRKARPTILSGKVHGEPWILLDKRTSARTPNRLGFFKDEAGFRIVWTEIGGTPKIKCVTFALEFDNWPSFFP